MTRFPLTFSQELVNNYELRVYFIALNIWMFSLVNPGIWFLEYWPPTSNILKSSWKSRCQSKHCMYLNLLMTVNPKYRFHMFDSVFCKNLVFHAIGPLVQAPAQPLFSTSVYYSYFFLHISLLCRMWELVDYVIFLIIVLKYQHDSFNKFCTHFIK